MAYSKTAKVNGSNQEYTLRADLKKYTLRDVGFQQTAAGNFATELSLNPNSPYGDGFKLKITVDKTLTGFKMAITTPNGLQKYNIFKNDENKDSVTQFKFIMDNMITRGVFEPIK